MAGAAFRLSGDGQVELLHVADETWIRASADRVGAAVDDPAVWAAFWPGLVVAPTERRGAQGVRLAVVPGTVPGTAWRGTAELYVHPDRDGVLLFHFLRVDPSEGRRVGRRELTRAHRAAAAAGRVAAWAVKDRLEDRLEDRAAPPGGRPDGVPRGRAAGAATGRAGAGRRAPRPR